MCTVIIRDTIPAFAYIDLKTQKNIGQDIGSPGQDLNPELSE
jgi:hypothetical protein